MHACQHNAHNHACTFLYLLIAFNRAEFGDDDENESFSGGPMYSLKDFYTSEAICACVQAQCLFMCMRVSMFGHSF